MVTVYAFSIDNFKRPPEEVAQLMTLAKVKFIEMIQRLSDQRPQATRDWDGEQEERETTIGTCPLGVAVTHAILPLFLLPVSLVVSCPSFLSLSQ